MAKRTETEQQSKPSTADDDTFDKFAANASIANMTATSIIIAIEPDLRLLKGLVTVLRYLGERSASDMIEPTAIAAISIPAEEAIDRMIAFGRHEPTQE